MQLHDAGQNPSAAAYLHVVLLRGAGILCPTIASNTGHPKGALVQLFIKEGKLFRHPAAPMNLPDSRAHAGESKGPVFHSKPVSCLPPSTPQQVPVSQPALVPSRIAPQACHARFASRVQPRCRRPRSRGRGAEWRRRDRWGAPSCGNPSSPSRCRPSPSRRASCAPSGTSTSSETPPAPSPRRPAKAVPSGCLVFHSTPPRPPSPFPSPLISPVPALSISYPSPSFDFPTSFPAMRQSRSGPVRSRRALPRRTRVGPGLPDHTGLSNHGPHPGPFLWPSPAISWACPVAVTVQLRPGARV